MSDRSAIEWTEATWNPTTRCDRVSSGCDNCYALTSGQAIEGGGCGEVSERRESADVGAGLRPDGASGRAGRSVRVEEPADGVRELHERSVPRPGSLGLRTAGLPHGAQFREAARPYGGGHLAQVVDPGQFLDGFHRDAHPQVRRPHQLVGDLPQAPRPQDPGATSWWWGRACPGCSYRSRCFSMNTSRTHCPGGTERSCCRPRVVANSPGPHNGHITDSCAARASESRSEGGRP